MNKLKFSVIGLAALSGLLLAFSVGHAGVLAPPVVVDLQPPAGTHLAGVGASVSVTYDQDMDATTVNPQSFAVHARQTGWLTETLSVTGGTIMLDPTSPFHAGELVQASATTATLSLGGEAPLLPTVWQFNTATWGGNGVFHEHQVLTEYANSRFAALGDLDGDSDLDMITTSCFGRTRIYQNDGSGTFTDIQNFVHTDYCLLDVNLGDLDGDGDLDAVLIDLTAAQPNFVLTNDGSGIFALSATFASDDDTYGELGDLDGDGDLDLFVTSGGFGIGALRVWLNDGSGAFTLAHTFDDVYEHTHLALGDLDGDGDLDAFTTSWNNMFNKVWLNDGTGAFTEAQAIPSANTYGVQLGDLDGDGDLDAYLANLTIGLSALPDQVWLNDGAGYFMDSGQRLNTVDSVLPALGDLDADGDLDIYLAGGGNIVESDQVWANDGEGTFSLYRTVSEAYAGAGVTLGDLDADGNLDAVVYVNEISDEAFQVYLNGDWTRVDPMLDAWGGAIVQCPGDTEHVYRVGGIDSSWMEIDDVCRYDVADGTWHALAPLPVVNRFPDLTCYRGKIYAAGGLNTGGSLDSLYIYDIAADTWSAGADLPRFNVAAALGAWDGKLYLAGGFSGIHPWVPLDDVHVYDIATDTWTANGGTDMPVASNFGGVAQVGPYLYVVGGLSGDYSNNLNTTQRYNMATDTWELGPTFTSRRAALSLAVTEDYLYAIGGDENGGEYWGDFTDTVERLDLSQWPGGAWADNGDPMPVALYTHSFCSASLTGGEIWAVGGLDLTEQPVDVLMYYPAEPCLGNTFDFELAPESLEGEAYRGGSVTYLLTLTNTGDLPDAYDITASSAWTVTLSTFDTLDPGDSQELLVTVTVPPEAGLGDADTAVITVTSQGDDLVWASASLTTTVVTDWVDATTALPHDHAAYAFAQCPETPNSFYLIYGDTLRYDVETGIWTILAPPPDPWWWASAVCYQGKIYMAGGEYYGAQDKFSIYDIATDTWNRGHDLPRAVFGAPLAAWDGKLYLVGGTVSAGMYPANQVDIYNIALGIWMPHALPNVPIPTSSPGYAQAGPYLYLVGGFSGDFDHNITATQRLDLSSGQWESGPEFTSARGGSNTIITAGHLYAVGGDGNGGWLDDTTALVEFLDLAEWPGGSWQDMGDPLPVPSQGNFSNACTEVLAGGEIWSIGGVDGNVEPYNYHDTTLYHPAEACLGNSFSFDLAPDADAQSGLPGATVTYTLHLTNTGELPDAYDIEIDSAWVTSAMPVAPPWPGESVDLVVTVHIPAGALADEQDVAVVTVTSQGDGTQVAEAALTTTVQTVRKPGLDAEVANLSGLPGEVVAFTVQLSNQGNITDTFTLSLEGNLWDVTLPFTTTESIAAHDVVTITVTVTIPVNLRSGEVDSVTLTAVSQGDPAQFIDVVLTTTVEVREVFLPVIGK